MTGRKVLPARIEGRHVLVALLAFFGVMFVANGIFLYFAVGTFNGFETSDAYRKGLGYNARIASDAVQAARGWRPALRYEPDTRRLVMVVRDQRGDPVSGLKISGRIGRPATDGADRPLTLREIAPATYAAPLELAPGQWTVAMRLYEASRSGTPAYRLKQRLWVENGR